MSRHTTETLTHFSTLSVVLTIVAGGLVHATGSGLACPDWPLCFGQWFPSMTGAVLYEHSHRIIAGVTGILVWGSGIVSWFDNRLRSSERLLWLAVMVLIVIQAVLGGLTVLWRLPSWVSTAHFITAHGTLAGMIVLSWSAWRRRTGLQSSGTARFVASDKLWIGGVTLFLVCVQMVVGAWLRHIGSPGAPPDSICEMFPNCEPTWVNYMTDYYIFYYVWHRLLAVLTSVAVVTLAWTFRDFRERIDTCYRLGILAAIGVFVQVLLGALTVRSSLSIVTATLHTAGAVVLFFILIVINLELWTPRGLGPKDR